MGSQRLVHAELLERLNRLLARRIRNRAGWLCCDPVAQVHKTVPVYCRFGNINNKWDVGCPKGDAMKRRECSPFRSDLRTARASGTIYLAAAAGAPFLPIIQS